MQIPKRYVFLESAPNVSAIVGHDTYFVCNGGIKWTYEGGMNRGHEIGNHPAPMDFKKDTNVLYSSPSNYIISGRQINPISVYSMQDDRGRLILRIDNASLTDGGIYRCHGEVNYVDAYLSVHPPEHFAINRSSGLPTIPLAAAMIKFFRMFPSDQLNQEARPSRTVSYNESGVFSHGNVEIGPNLEWVRILDPKAPEAPTPLWCKFEMQDLWHGKVSTL
ncbi:unnamed protein product [Hymenolepis diminuta]|uniref:Ig-like domain-containing protein n=1 Tax=Hymenolepis diminuta TaxID=6216 RepID=A0A0R3SZA5_HYMDI|nr:unnamed protein product [Hymenolepis diminuta]